MANDWIIDVLGDLRAFAAENGLPTLASQLEEALTVAAVETIQDGMGSRIDERACGASTGAAI